MPRHAMFKDPALQTDPLVFPEPELPWSDEAPRAVYLASCARIAEALAASGFRYLKSRQECKRRQGEFEHAILFYSTRGNYPGVHVELQMSGHVSSKRLQAWRASMGDEPAGDHVAGGLAHNLGTTYRMISWELANPAERDATIQDALAFIRSDILPFFALFDEPAALIARLEREEVPGMSPTGQVHFAYCFGGKEQAQRVLDRFLRTRPDIAAAVERALLADTPDALPGGYAGDVIGMRQQLGLH